MRPREQAIAHTHNEINDEVAFTAGNISGQQLCLSCSADNLCKGPEENKHAANRLDNGDDRDYMEEEAVAAGLFKSFIFDSIATNEKK